MFSTFVLINTWRNQQFHVALFSAKKYILIPLKSPRKGDEIGITEKFEECNDGEMSSIGSSKSDSDTKDGESDASSSKSKDKRQ